MDRPRHERALENEEIRSKASKILESVSLKTHQRIEVNDYEPRKSRQEASDKRRDNSWSSRSNRGVQKSRDTISTKDEFVTENEPSAEASFFS